MEQTAIEWLEEQMKTWGLLPRWMRDDIVQQAKEMEKQQIIESYDKGEFNQGCNGTAEEYYNKTFKSE